MVDLPATQDGVALYYMALQNIPGLGPRRQARLFNHFKDWQGVLRAPDHPLKGLGLTGASLNALRQLRDRPSQSIYLDKAKREYELCQRNNWQLLCQEDPRYPALLKQIDTPPSLLYISGHIEALATEQVAMVGSRHASASGMYTAESLAAEFANAGLTVTSGMALGIDSVCHHAAIKASKPTIAVMGTGLARVYPHRNRHLAEKIVAMGALVSEFPINTAPQAANFPQRNRIVSGLCRAVVVVEAAKRSGSLITARYALEQNREVFAIPGSLHNPQSEGCNELIKQGACLLSSMEDVLNCLPLQSKPRQFQAQDLDQGRANENEAAFNSLSAEGQRATTVLASVLLHIGFEPTSLEEIERRTHTKALELTPLLIELQLSGRVQQQGAEYVRVR